MRIHGRHAEVQRRHVAACEELGAGLVASHELQAFTEQLWVVLRRHSSFASLCVKFLTLGQVGSPRQLRHRAGEE